MIQYIFLTTRVNYNPICNPYTKPGWLDLLVKLEALGPGQHELNCHELRSSNIRSTMHFERNCMHHMMSLNSYSYTELVCNDIVEECQPTHHELFKYIIAIHYGHKLYF